MSFFGLSIVHPLCSDETQESVFHSELHFPLDNNVIPLGETVSAKEGNLEPMGPAAPSDLTAAFISSRFVTLSWTRPLSPNTVPILGYTIYYKELNSDRERVLNTTHKKSRLEEELNVQGLVPNKNYTFRIVAHSPQGKAKKTIVINHYYILNTHV